MGNAAPGTEDSRRLTQLLIALNSTTDVDRSAISKLARDHSWLEKGGRGRPRSDFARVSESTLERVRPQLQNSGRLAQLELERAREAGATLVTRVEDAYPPPLLDLDLAPPVLYVRGHVPSTPGISVVGSRNADVYGLETAESFARHLAGVGLTVVSGLARGVDSAAHKGALAAGRTVAVLGCGIDVAYPRGNTRLAQRIAESGAVISEFPTGTPPYAGHFPMRNRIIAALGLGTFVVRATARSGSLITARLALELGRDVYALPGNIYDPRSIGPNTLIRDGALPVQHPREIVESLPWRVQEELESPDPIEAIEAEPPPKRLLSLYRVLSHSDAATAEELAHKLDRRVDEVLAELLELELGGWARRQPGPAFRRRL